MRLGRVIRAERKAPTKRDPKVPVALAQLEELSVVMGFLGHTLHVLERAELERFLTREGRSPESGKASLTREERLPRFRNGLLTREEPLADVRNGLLTREGHDSRL